MPVASQLARIIEEASPQIPNPNPILEQYTTPGDIAARLAVNIKIRGLNNEWISDLGAGTCRLSLALSLVGVDKIIPVDADQRFAGLCIKSYERLGLEPPTYITSWIKADEGPLKPGRIGIIVMNPPFGVQRRGADTEFLLYAMSLQPYMIYAILKTGNESYHNRLAEEKGYRHQVLYREWFPIPASMEHHYSRIRRVRVNVSLFKHVR